MNTHKICKILISLTTVLLFTGQVWAADSEATPIYEIELLVFERPLGTTQESWSEEAEQVEEPDAGQAIGFLTPPMSKEITPLPLTDSELLAAAYTLETQGLKPLLHLRWQQSVESRQDARPYWVQTTNLKGLVKVSLGRYLHLDLDLLLDDEARGEKIRIVQHRRMRSRELHHLDHPRLGVLGIIKPVVSTPPGGTDTQEADLGRK